MALDPRAKFLITAATDFAKANRESKTFLGSLDKSARFALKSTAALATAGAAGLTALTISANRSADALAKNSDKLGIATEKLAALQLAGRLTGNQNEKMTLSMQRMTRRIAEASQGAGEAQGALKELGLDAEQLARLPLDQQMLRVATAMRDVDNQSQKIRLGFKLFDSEGVDTIRTLDLIAEDFARVQEEAVAFGVALSRVDARKIEQANDAVERAETAFAGIGTNIALAIAPLREDLANSFSEAAKESRGFKDEINATMEALVVGANFGANAVRGIQLAFLTAKLAALQLQEVTALEGKKGAFFRALLGAKGPAIALAGDDEKVQRVRDEIDETGRAVDILLGKFQSADAALAKFRQLQEDAARRARESVTPTGGTTVEGTATENFGDKEKEALAKRLQTVQEALRTETEAIRAAFVERAAIAQEAFDRQLEDDKGNILVSETELASIKLQLAQQTADQLLEIERKKEEERAALNEKTERIIRDARKQTASLALGLLQALGSENKAFAAAAIVLEKAMAIQRLLLANRVAAELAFGSQIIPGDPSSLARAAAAKAAVLAQGKISAALVAATGVVQIATLGSGSTGAPLGTPTNPAFTDSSSRQETRETRSIVEIHVHGGLLATAELKRILQEEFDADEVIIHGNSRQAAAIRNG